MFKYSLDNKRYHTFNYFLRTKFGSKVFKIPLDMGSTCPNTKNGGCIFCKNSSISNITNPSLNLMEQYESEVALLNKKWPNAKHIIYFQTGTNTYGDLSLLKDNIENFLQLKNVVGISIATRSDAINEDCLYYLKELNKRTFLTIELGLQSSNDNTLKFINRGHDKNNFEKTVKKLKKENIFVCAHTINGLPYETKEDMINTIKFINKINIDAIKIHMLYILKDTKLEKIYKKNSFHILTKDEYIDIICDQIEILNEKIVIERITGDPIKEDLITPTWLIKKFCVLNDIDKKLVERNTYQGKKNN